MNFNSKYCAYFYKVKMWTTLTEPETFALKGYEQGTNAPGRQSSGSDVYSAGYIMLKAHARVYRLYQQDFQKQQQGKTDDAKHTCTLST